MAVRFFLLVLAQVISCQGIFTDCDFYEELVPNREYFLYSPEYPSKYPPGKSCRWYAVSPPKTKIHLVCEEFYIPPSRDCRLDRMSVSRSGRIDLSDVENYCGNKKIDLLSNENRLNVILQTVSYSPGGSFFCHLNVKENNPPPIPPPKPNCICGYTNSMRIVGGTETDINEYPMMAAVVDGLYEELLCGATIISQKYALTAAHCLFNKVPSRLGLLVGDHDISVGNETDSSQIYFIERFYLHPSYNWTTLENDAALVEVKEEIQFSRKVGPACLPFLNKRDSFTGETVQALGWGSTHFTGPSSDKLLKVSLNVVSLQQCKPSYGDYVSDRQICTYEEDKDACQTDSGGPLLWRDPSTGLVKVVGIISYGIYCATTNPSVNTRVTSYLDWIKATTGEEYCVV